MSPTIGETAPAWNAESHDTLSTNFRMMERYEWWLWSAAVAVTLLLTAGLGFISSSGFRRKWRRCSLLLSNCLKS